MNILIIGSGGRENALANAYAKSARVKKIFVVPGNSFIDYSNKRATSLSGVIATDFDRILTLVWKNKIDLVDVAQDEPLAEGFVDRLSLAGVSAFGPTQKAAQIEWSKDWARGFMKKYRLPIPVFKSFNSSRKAINYLKAQKEQEFYVKASGLALGKGAIYAQSKYAAAKGVYSMKQFGKSGETFLIEECLSGEEFSLFAICDGKSYKILGSAQDHKTLYNRNQGPNTGGMGCVSNPKVVSKSILKIIENNILTPFIKGMEKEGRAYMGIIYLGGMITPKGIKIIEFNSRWGDPEAQVLLPGIKNDYLELVEAAIAKKLSKIKITTDQLSRVSLAGVSYGYPTDYSAVKGKKVFGLDNAKKVNGVSIYGAGITKKGSSFIVSGGRVFHVVGVGKTVSEARSRAYSAIALTGIEVDNLHYRTDIGWRDFERESS